MDIFQNNKIFYICNDPERALGLEKVLKNYHIICIDYSPLVDEIEKAGISIFCLEKELGELNPIFRNSNKLLETSECQAYIANNIELGTPPNVMFFKIAPNLEKTCENLGYKILNTTSDLNRKFENKISQFEAFSEIRDYFPDTILTSLEEVSYDYLYKNLGGKFVVQFDRGHTGEGTVFIDSEGKWNKLVEKFLKRKARISEFVAGDYWTVNCCNTRFGTLVGGLSYQITGVPECTAVSGGTVGNDWSYSIADDCETDNQIRSQILEIASKVGEIMKKSDFMGLFGLDLVVNSDCGDPNSRVKLIEVNARQPASTSMHTKLMINKGQIPLQLFHLSEFMGITDAEYQKLIGATKIKDFIKAQNQEAIKSIEAAQLIIRNISDSQVEIVDDFSSGIYKTKPVESKDSEPIGTGYSVEDISNDEEILVYAKTKRHKVSSNDEVGRIQARTSLIRPDKKVKNVIMTFVDKISKLYR